MSTRVEVEDLEVTRGERLLTVILSGFLFVAGVWGYDRIDEGRELRTFELRLAFVLVLLIAALGLAAWQRRRRSRWVLTGHAAVGTAGALAILLGIDYVDRCYRTDAGPLVLAGAGSAITLVAIAVLHRHLARRLPRRRVRRGDCPFCGYPGRGGVHCEGCGRSVVAACARCESPRRVGTEHCGACGQA